MKWGPVLLIQLMSWIPYRHDITYFATGSAELAKLSTFCEGKLMFRNATKLALFSAICTLAATPVHADEWIPLFNGKDLSGWKMIDPPSGQFKSVAAKKNEDGKVIAYVGTLKDGKEETVWRVENGTIIGAGHATHLFTEKDDYTDFHYKIVAKINNKGNSGQYFRTKFGPGFPAGYEAQINATGGDRIKTGSLYPDGRTKLKDFAKDICVYDKAAHGPDEYFTQEVHAEGAKITIMVNGKKTIEFTDPNKTHTKGHFALQGHDPGTVVTFKSIEYKPLTK